MTRVIHFASTLVAAMLAGNASAAQPVRDINANPVASTALLSQWTTIGSTTYFLLGGDRYGEELWKTDGTPSGTTIVKDINPGPAGSGITSMLAVDGVLYFFANDGTNGNELWRSDGTPSGTRVVADINTGPEDGVASSEIVSVGGVLYFVGSRPGGDAELWRSDGTASGTWRVADICVGPCSSDPGQLVVAGSRLFFVADDATTGHELWSSDGTSGGTRRVADIYAGSQGSEPAGITATPAGVFFTAMDAGRGREIWFAAADGTTARIVSDMSPGPTSSTFSSMGVIGSDVVLGAVTPGNPLVTSGGIHHLFRASSSGGVQLLAQDLPLYSGVPVPMAGFVPVGARLLFLGSDPVAPGELWATDGTPAGTGRLGASSGLMSTSLIGGGGDLDGLLAGNEFYFLGYTGSAGNNVDLWRTDGSEAGTVRYASLPQPSVLSSLASFQGRIFFAGGWLGTNGWELWSTDGTDAGTAEFADLNPGEAGSSPWLFTVAGSRLLFVTGDNQPWASDGTVSGTRRLVPELALRTGDSDPQQITSLGNRVVFSAQDDVHGVEPWVSDGTAAGTVLLGDLNPGWSGSYPSILGTAGALAFFSAASEAAGNELWATDGTPGGTYLVRDIHSGPGSSDPGARSKGVAMSGVLYFSANDGIHGVQLWRSDGTFAGTWAVTNLGAGQNSCIQHLHVVNGRLVYLLCESGAKRYWWQSDGTPEGTSRVTDAVAMTSQDSVILNGRVYFGGQATPFSSTDRGQLWRTDGTAAGTTQVVDFDPAAAFTGVPSLWAMPGRVLFSYCATGLSCRLFSSDGTPGGTVAISPDPVSGSSAVVGNLLVYTAIAPSGGLVLRATDGTAAGTVDVLQPDPNGQFLGALASVHGQALFTQVDPVHGPSVWRTNGTAASTVLVADLDPGTEADFVPYGYVAAGDRVFFQAWQASTGTELYAIKSLVPNAGDDAARVDSGAAVTVAVSANDGSLSGNVNAATVSIASPPRGGTVSTGPGVGAITYRPNAGFQGTDQFTYTIADMAGNVSAPATVFVTVAPPAGPAPGTPSSGPSPEPPVPTPTPQPPSSGDGNGGGGSMAGTGLLLLALLLCWLRIHGAREQPDFARRTAFAAD